MGFFKSRNDESLPLSGSKGGLTEKLVKAAVLLVGVIGGTACSAPATKADAAAPAAPEVKADAVKADEVKADAVKADEVKADEVKADEVKADEAKADDANGEPKAEGANQEGDANAPSLGEEARPMPPMHMMAKYGGPWMYRKQNGADGGEAADAPTEADQN